MRSSALVLTVVSVLGLAAPASARPLGPRGHHDDGFFMRLAGGVGFGSATLKQDSDTGFSGAAGQVSLAFGGMLTRNFALHAELAGLNMFEPSVTVDGVDQGNAQNTSTSLASVGLGVTGYIMPLNLYVSGSVGAGVGTVKSHVSFLGGTFTVKEDTDPGITFDVLVGKEWFVGPRWGLGVALHALFASLPTDDGEALRVFGLGVLFSATMN